MFDSSDFQNAKKIWLAVDQVKAGDGVQGHKVEPRTDFVPWRPVKEPYSSMFTYCL